MTRFAFAVLAAFAVYAGELDTSPASMAVLSWLATVDAGDYAQSWEDAAKLLHATATREQWEGTMRKVRAPKGAVLGRRVKYARYTQDSPTDPGHFVEIEIETRFEKQARATEIVTALVTADGTWKVSGYTIK